jgi:hypothetical protein
MSTALPQWNEINNVNNLQYNKPYQDFDYSKYINEIKLSNFAHAGGGAIKKNSRNTNNNRISNVIKHMYSDYLKGKPSYMKGGGTTGMNLPISVQDTYNLNNLNYNTCYNAPRVKYVSTVPYSSFQL